MGLRKFVVLCLIGMGMFLFTGSASAQGSLAYTISPTQGLVGTTITFEGTGCPVDDTITRAEVSFAVFAAVGSGVTQGSYIASGGAQSKPDGSFKGTATKVSDAASLGDHQTQISCANGQTVQGALFRVTAAPSSTTTSPSTAAPTTTPTTVAPATTVPTSGNDGTTDAAPTTTAPASTTSTVPPTTTPTTAPLYSAQSTGTTTTTRTLAVTGPHPMVYALLVLGVMLFVIGFGLCFMSHRDRFGVIENFGRTIAGLFTPTPLK